MKTLNSLAAVLTRHNHKKLKLILAKYSLKAKVGKMNSTIKNIEADKGLDEFKKEFSSFHKQFYRKESLAEKHLQLVVSEVKVDNYSFDKMIELIQEISKSESESGRPIKVDIQKDLSKEITKKIRLNLNGVPLKKLIGYTCQQLDISYRLDGDTLYFSKEPYLDLSSVFYPMSAQMLEYIEDDGMVPNCIKFLKDLGVGFDPGARAKFPKRTMGYIITNTDENHMKIKEVFDFLNTVKSRDPFAE